MKLTFTEAGDFNSCYAAEEWCKAAGLSVGSMQRGEPRCLMRGDVYVAKWRNLSAAERIECHGAMTGDMRNGPVTVEVFDVTPTANEGAAK